MVKLGINTFGVLVQLSYGYSWVWLKLGIDTVEVWEKFGPGYSLGIGKVWAWLQFGHA